MHYGLVYILAFFIPIFGFITFWVFSGRENELKNVGRQSIIAGFFGVILYIILATLGITVFRFLWQGMGLFGG